MKHLFALIISLGIITIPCHSVMQTAYAEHGSIDNTTIQSSLSHTSNTCECEIASEKTSNDKLVNEYKNPIQSSGSSYISSQNNYLSYKEVLPIHPKPPGGNFSIRQSLELRTVQQNK